MDFRSAASLRGTRGPVSDAFFWRPTSTFTWIEEADSGSDSAAFFERTTGHETRRLTRGGVRFRIPRPGRSAARRGERAGRSACAQEAAFHSQGETRDLPVHA